MNVKRIVTNIQSANVDAAKHFYSEIFGLNLLMDLGWIQTYGNDAQMPIQISIAKEGGSGAPVPDLSIEVDDLDAAEQRIKEAAIAFEYGPVTEPWGIRRFFVRDPFGKLINVSQHV
ncbi:MAG: VOC family protein [Lysobacterales bacterium]